MTLGQDDSFLFLDGQVIRRVGNVTGEQINTTFELWERSSAPRGMGLEVSLHDNLPDALIVANWANVYGETHSAFAPVDVPEVFDLCLKLSWAEQELQPQERRSYKVTLRIPSPDFSSPVFTRWDMPSAFSIENGQLFPRTINTTARVMNTKGGDMSNLNLIVTYPYELAGDTSSELFVIPAGKSAYPLLKVNSKDMYEDMVVPVSVACVQSGTVLDQFTRNVYIPASPFSDEGLVIQIDSVSTVNYPDINLVFRGEIEATGQKLLNLFPENIFLYENQKRLRNFTMEKFTGGGSALADVCFVLDCSGSMGNEINAVRQNLGEFADSLRERGFDYRVGVVTFSTTVDDVWGFTNDIELMKQRLAGVNLWGGTEDSPAALYRASELSWRPGSKRTIIWITDEPYPEHSFTQEDIVNRMLSLDIKVHGVGLTSLQTDWFNPIVLPTGGSFYDINGNFRDILLDVARLRSEDRYLLTFASDLSKNEPRTLRVEVHYAGLGGADHIDIGNGVTNLGKTLACYPNPFNPIVKIKIDAFDGIHGDVGIYNMLGQRIRQFSVTPNTPTELVWDAHDDNGFPVSSGLYVVKLTTQSAAGHVNQEMQRILYLK